MFCFRTVHCRYFFQFCIGRNLSFVYIYIILGFVVKFLFGRVIYGTAVDNYGEETDSK